MTRARQSPVHAARRLLVLGALLAWAAARPPVLAQERAPSIAGLRASAAPRWVTVGFEFRDALTPDLRRAVSEGVPLSAAYDIEVQTERWYWWNGVPFSRRILRTLRFDAAKGLYLLDAGGESESRSFETLDPAVDELLAVADTTTPLAEPLPPGTYLLRVRAALAAETPRSWFVFGGGPSSGAGWVEAPLVVAEPKGGAP